MTKNKTKPYKPLVEEPILDDSETLILSENKRHLTKELLDKVPWLKDRYLLPGEEAEDYDLRLKALLDSIEINNALDAIMVKDIHDEMREIHRLKILKNTFLVDGMYKYLNRKMGGSYYGNNMSEVELEISKFITGSLGGDEGDASDFVSFIKSMDITLADLQMHAFKEKAEDILQVDIQMVRHQKNVRESLKLIEMRRNNALARQRLEQEMERLCVNTLEIEHDEP